MVYISIFRYKGYLEILTLFGPPFIPRMYQGAAIFVVTIDMRVSK